MRDMLDTERIPLTLNTQICIGGSMYAIQDVISFGGSCIAYSAKRKVKDYEESINVKPRLAVIKEFYPYELADIISRSDDNLSITPDGQVTFDKLKARFEHGVIHQIAYYSEDSNKALPPAQVDSVNNTVYSVVDLAQGDILENCRVGLSIYGISEVLVSLCNAIKRLHNNGWLYLDLKPSNIFLFEKERNESRRIALFDFDTLLSVNEMATAIIPFSQSWSPYEQEYKQIKDISFASDIYSIGAIFYWLVTGKKVTNEILDCIEWEDFSFLDECAVLKNVKNARITSERILSRTLKRVPKERVQSMEVLLG